MHVTLTRFGIDVKAANNAGHAARSMNSRLRAFPRAGTPIVKQRELNPAKHDSSA